MREIGTAVGISSTSVVDYNLRILEREGHLRRDRELSRGIELAGRKQVPTIPVIGRIAAGQPIEAVVDPEDSVESSQRLGRHRWKAERSIAWLAGCRRLRIRYDRDSERFFAFAMLACARLGYNRLPGTAEAHARSP